MRKALTILTATTVVVVATGIAMASSPDANGVIHGCYDTKHGDLRVIDTEAGQSCNPNETLLSWNQIGPLGPTGPQGPQGQQGPPGPPGAVGYRGAGFAIAPVPSTDTSIGHITLPAGKFITSVSVGFNNPSGSEVLVQCEFLGGRAASLKLDVSDPFDAGVITFVAPLLSLSQTSYDLLCRSVGGSAMVVGGEITAVQVSEIFNLG